MPLRTKFLSSMHIPSVPSAFIDVEDRNPVIPIDIDSDELGPGLFMATRLSVPNVIVRKKKLLELPSRTDEAASGSSVEPRAKEARVFRLEGTAPSRQLLQPSGDTPQDRAGECPSEAGRRFRRRVAEVARPSPCTVIVPEEKASAPAPELAHDKEPSLAELADRLASLEPSFELIERAGRFNFAPDSCVKERKQLQRTIERLQRELSRCRPIEFF
jgi:hypothetical protein